MYLPNELVVAILQYLERSHLKSARLVCQTWCFYASGSLFNKIYVGPNRVDVEVFDNITQHPVLSKCVRKLVYDGCEFVPNLSKISYVRDLWTQTRVMFDSKYCGPESPNPQINEWFRDVACEEELPRKALLKWEDRDLINQGYKEYQEHSVYQQRALLSGEFIESLVRGLSRLVHLKHVSLKGEWPNPTRKCLSEHRHGTPLARRWSLLHCAPHGWEWDPQGYNLEEMPDGICHYWIITTALVRANRHIDEFAVGQKYTSGLSPEVFERDDPYRLNSLGLDIGALSGLKRLHLCLASCAHGTAAPMYCDNTKGLPKLLGSMHSIQCLNLTLSYSSRFELSLYTYDQVFPRAMVWNNLKDLALYNFASTANDLLRLLLIQMPHLEYVFFGSTQLLKGCWESVIECLKQFNEFTLFCIDGDFQLYDCNGELLEYDSEEINDYIMQGGRSPCLSDDQPTSASQDYMLKLDASLRDRLLEMKSSRTNVAF